MASPSEGPLRHFIREIRRRSLLQVMGIYIFSSWVVLQVIDTLDGVVILPEWFGGLAIGFLVLGLPIVLATAFVQESGARAESHDAPSTGPEGAPDVRPAPTVPSRLFTWRNAILGGVGAFGLWGVLATGWLVFGDRPSPVPGNALTSAGATLGTLIDERPSIAVLPLENLSGNVEDEVFTAGMHDEIQGRLSKIGGLRVIAREAVMRYQGTTQPLQQIAQELRVGNLVTGTVRRAANRVRTSVRLVNPETGENLWTGDYDRELSPEQIFDIWTEVAEEIAQALNTELTSDEQVRVAARPTDSEEAYDYFLLGKSLWNQGSISNRVRAIGMFEQAVEADSTFVEAWAWLSSLHTNLWWAGLATEARLAAATEALDRAGELDPSHPEYLAALGDYAYYGLEDYEQATEAYEEALRADPNVSYVWMGLGFTRRRTGDFEGAIGAFGRAEGLDLTSGPSAHIADTYALLRQWDEANAALARSRILDPTELGRWRQLGTILYRQGDLAGARAQIQQAAVAGSALPGVRERLVAFTYMAERRLDEALLVVQEADYQARGSPRGDFMEPKSLLVARILDFAGRSDEAREFYEDARVYLEGQLDRDPDHAWGHSALGLTLAGLGERDAAVEAGLRALELWPLEQDTLVGTFFVDLLAAIYSKVGDVEAAMDLIEDLMERPSFLTVPRLRMEPDWDPLRAHPRFQALVG